MHLALALSVVSVVFWNRLWYSVTAVPKKEEGECMFSFFPVWIWWSRSESIPPYYHQGTVASTQT